MATDVSKHLFAPTSWDEYTRLQLVGAIAKEEARRELARRDLLEYIKYFHPDYIAEPFHVYVCREIMAFLNAIVAGEDPCLLLEAPPRHGKSMICSDNLPSFALGFLSLYLKNPQIIHVGYSQTFIEKFGRKNRDRLMDPRFQNLFPHQVADPKAASVSDVQTIGGGGYYASGMGGAITGLGGHLLLLDDPIKGSEEANSEGEMKKQLEWYMSVLATRAMDKCGKLMMLTRWSNADVAGHVQRIAKDNPEADQWKVIKFPAIATDNDVLGRSPGEPLCPARFPLPRLRKERAGKTPKVWSAMYQQNPVPETGGFFEANDVEACITPLKKYPKLDDLVIYIPGDFAIGTKKKNDFTVFWPFGVCENNHIWFLNDIVRFKGGGNQIVEELLRLGRTYRPRALVLEDGHIFRGIRDTLEQRMRESGDVFFIDAPYPTQDKLARAEPLRARMQQRMVHLPDVPTVKDVVFKEMMAFGEDSVGVHDDTVDAMATGVMRLSHLRAFRKAKAGKPEPVLNGYNSWTMEDLVARTKSGPRGKGRRVKAKAPSHLNGRARKRKL